MDGFCLDRLFDRRHYEGMGAMKHITADVPEDRGKLDLDIDLGVARERRRWKESPQPRLSLESLSLGDEVVADRSEQP
jgi:hypothetical protein